MAKTLVTIFDTALRLSNIPEPEREYTFAAEANRRWRFDYAWPDKRIAVELEGGVWQGGAHQRAARFNSDCDKYNNAAVNGWTVLRYTRYHMRDIRCILETLADVHAMPELLMQGERPAVEDEGPTVENEGPAAVGEKPTIEDEGPQDTPEATEKPKKKRGRPPKAK